jgi:hypothetical protein
MKTLKDLEQEDVEMAIIRCQENNHIHQVAFSTFHHALTQVCFTCGKIRTSMRLTKKMIDNTK